MPAGGGSPELAGSSDARLRGVQHAVELGQLGARHARDADWAHAVSVALPRATVRAVRCVPQPSVVWLSTTEPRQRLAQSQRLASEGGASDAGHADAWEARGAGVEVTGKSHAARVEAAPESGAAQGTAQHSALSGAKARLDPCTSAGSVSGSMGRRSGTLPKGYCSVVPCGVPSVTSDTT